jgi:hypothetical protein
VGQDDSIGRSRDGQADDPVAAKIGEFEKLMPQSQRIFSPARSRFAVRLAPQEGHVKFQVGMQ